MNARRVAAAWGMIAVLASSAQAQQPITVLTGGMSGVYYPLGVTIAKIYADIPDSQVQVQTTDGSVENLARLQQGDAQLGFALGDALQDAWNGNVEAGFSGRLNRLRVIGAIYPILVQIVATKASGIRTLAGLKGKTLSVGAARSGTELNARAILVAADLGPLDVRRVLDKSFAESIELMIKQQLDATVQSAGPGVASLRELSEAIEITMVPVPKRVVRKMGAPFTAAVIPAGTYIGQDKAVPTASVMNYLVTSSAVSDELAYQMTKMVFDSLPELAIAHLAGREIKLANAANPNAVPLHSGAIRYYREKGLME